LGCHFKDVLYLRININAMVSENDDEVFCLSRESEESLQGSECGVIGRKCGRRFFVMFGSIWPMAGYDFDLLFSSISCRPSNSKKEAKTYGRGWWRRRRANSKLPVNMELREAVTLCKCLSI
jgi:hypothetical protein